MEPTPETSEALRALADAGQGDLTVLLARITRGVSRVVPSCVGLSLTLVEDDLTFTMIATGHEVAALDAVPYLADGPCETSVETGDVVELSTEDVLDEHRWSAFARATATRGVRSTLSLPILDLQGRVAAGVNLYSSTTGAFEHHHEELARICSGWQPGIVTDADLPFRTRAAARRAPQQVRDQHALDAAIGTLVSTRGLSVEGAEAVIRDAAARAGVDAEQAARIILHVLNV